MSSFYKGNQIFSLNELVKQEFVFVYDRLFRVGFTIPWEFVTACWLVNFGYVNYATRKTDVEKTVATLYEKEGVHGD